MFIGCVFSCERVCVYCINSRRYCVPNSVVNRNFVKFWGKIAFRVVLASAKSVGHVWTDRAMLRYVLLFSCITLTIYYFIHERYRELKLENARSRKMKK